MASNFMVLAMNNAVRFLVIACVLLYFYHVSNKNT